MTAPAIQRTDVARRSSYSGPVTALLVTAEDGHTGAMADPENVYSLVAAVPPNPSAAQLHVALAEVLDWAGTESLMVVRLVNETSIERACLTIAAASVGRNRRSSLIVI